VLPVPSVSYLLLVALVALAAALVVPRALAPSGTAHCLFSVATVNASVVRHFPWAGRRFLIPLASDVVDANIAQLSCKSIRYLVCD
jgi:hypothetical protein